MKNILFSCVLFLLASVSQAALRVVATTPDVADLVSQVGGEHVQVESLAKGTEDIHAIPQRPSFVTKLNQADAVAHLGLGAEHAFLPALIEAASNPQLAPGQKGDINCSRYITPKEIPSSLSRSEGDLHPDGNPHYNIDPRSGALMIKSIVQTLSELDPGHAHYFSERAETYKKELEQHLLQWKKYAESTRGVKAISQHKDMVYLADFLGIQLLGEVEPKPGIAPNPKHLAQLAERMKQHQVRLIINEVQYSDKTSRWLSEQTGAKMAVVATMGGAFPDSKSYVGMIDHNIKAILEALK